MRIETRLVKKDVETDLKDTNLHYFKKEGSKCFIKVDVFNKGRDKSDVEYVNISVSHELSQTVLPLLIMNHDLYRLENSDNLTTGVIKVPETWYNFIVVELVGVCLTPTDNIIITFVETDQ